MRCRCCSTPRAGPRGLMFWFFPNGPVVTAATPAGSLSLSNVQRGRAGSGPRGVADGCPDPVEAGAGGDVEIPAVGAAEADVCHLLRHRHVQELLAVRTEHAHAVAGGRPHPAFFVHPESVRYPDGDLGKNPAVDA